MTDLAILALALLILVAGFAFALWWVDRDAPHALIDRIGAHLADGRPLIGDHAVTTSRRPHLFDQDEPKDAA